MKKRYWLWNALILALVFGFTAWSIAKEQNFALLPQAFALMRVEYIVAGALLSLGMYCASPSFSSSCSGGKSAAFPF